MFTADKSSYPDMKYSIYDTDFVRWFSGLNYTNVCNEVCLSSTFEVVVGYHIQITVQY